MKSFNFLFTCVLTQYLHKLFWKLINSNMMYTQFVGKSRDFKIEKWGRFYGLHFCHHFLFLFFEPSAFIPLLEEQFFMSQRFRRQAPALPTQKNGHTAAKKQTIEVFSFSFIASSPFPKTVFFSIVKEKKGGNLVVFIPAFSRLRMLMDLLLNILF